MMTSDNLLRLAYPKENSIDLSICFCKTITAAHPEILPLLCQTFTLLVKPWLLHRPQCTAGSSEPDSVVRWGQQSLRAQPEMMSGL